MIQPRHQYDKWRCVHPCRRHSDCADISAGCLIQRRKREKAIHWLIRLIDEKEKQGLQAYIKDHTLCFLVLKMIRLLYNCNLSITTLLPIVVILRTVGY